MQLHGTAMPPSRIRRQSAWAKKIGRLLATVEMQISMMQNAAMFQEGCSSNLIRRSLIRQPEALKPSLEAPARLLPRPRLRPTCTQRFMHNEILSNIQLPEC